MNPIRKGERIPLSITDLNNLGCGVGRHESDGRVVFVKGAVTGDTVRAQIIKVNQSYCVARLEEILIPSPHRGEDLCSAPLACGGCVYRHITYEHELSLKQSYVQNAFRKAGLPDVTVLPVRTTGKLSGYRNKGQYPVVKTKNGIRAGFYASKSHHIVPADTCMIQNPTFAPIVRFICDFAEKAGWSVYNEESGKGLLRHIYLRVGEKTGELMVCPVVTEKTLPRQDEFIRALTEAFPGVVSLMFNINRENTNVVLGKTFIALWGKEYIEDELCGLRFRIAPDSFYQVNRDGAELLYGLARQAAGLTGREVLMDLYCGTGTIGLSMARDAKALRGVEIVPSAVACAKENARRNGIENAEFFCADAGSREVILAAAGGVRPDVVVIDPPRKGSTRELVACLASLDVPKIVYVSCDPDTLARDCAWFSEAGYEIGDVTPVDMFPRTGHVESVVCLTRKNKQ
ncbi:MAG: 23S rRNA (uracil(1939)-C(5))-methyltransferase RlmD [Clostridia bacterium]|nr:23S rRNA (uracil(1939)-C(5))-methyltransferase RlmD [Clostridia bacterium]